jgi:8-oxo-dGTP pyrophosphatase MutT (NUDIX family)
MGRVKPRTHKTVYDFQWFQVRHLQGYGWIMTRGAAVVVLPVAPDGRVYMARIARAPTGQTGWELPGGNVEPGENVLSAGLRELEEECGLVARGKVKLLPTVYQALAGNGSAPHRLVIAEGVVPKARRPQPQREESIDRVRLFTRAEVRSLVGRGKITVYATLASLLLWHSSDG